ncbi:MAG: 3-dehydroquinate synthase [Ruminococcus sp.]|nr:3-dehydroquinate synthase [Ruminococcus sp.]
MKKISVKTSRPYEVIIQRGGLSRAGELISAVTTSKKCVIISDDIVAPLYAETLERSLGQSGISSSLFVFPNGEQSKSLSTLGKIYDHLCSSNLTRSDFIIALGGGVVGDITGFAAASYLRGLDFIQIPTTLLAQVDSSVGGKTAIDISGGKNLVGAFKQPALVICDSDTLKTLPPQTLADGMAESIKYGMIKDSELFDLIADHDLSTIDQVMDQMVYTCIDIKRAVVENDEFDHGERMLLNFGHTLGHAMEGWHNYTNYTHGMGVAAGMCIMSAKTAPAEVTERLKKCVETYGLPTDTEAPMAELLPFCATDKKCLSDRINYIVCEKIGCGEIRNALVSDFNALMEG